MNKTLKQPKKIELYMVLFQLKEHCMKTEEKLY